MKKIKSPQKQKLVNIEMTKKNCFNFLVQRANIFVLIWLFVLSSFSSSTFAQTQPKFQDKTKDKNQVSKEIGNRFKELKNKENLWDTDLQEKLQKEPFSQNQVIVKFIEQTKASQTAQKYSGKIEKRIKNTNNFVLSLPEKSKKTTEDFNKFITDLEKDPNIEYAEPDYYMTALGEKKSWGFKKVKAEEAHTNNSVTGDGVVVAVVDTGVDYLHEDLSNNIWSNVGETPDNSIDDDGNGYIDDSRGWDFIGESILIGINPDNDPMDGHGHGTHVAGIIAAEDNDKGVIGVAPKAKIMAVKVLDDDGYGLVSTISDGIIYAADNGADIINLSLGGLWPSRTLREAVNYAVQKNVVVAAAAGNLYSFNLLTFYPALYSNVISIGALDKNNQKTWWSNWGKVEVMAPGEEILSTMLDDHYASWSGTSMACPFVSGTLALIKEKHPAFSGTKLRQVLESYTSDLYHQGKDYLTGYGLIDAEFATGMLDDTLNLETNKHKLVADNDDSVTITARILDENGDPVQGEEIEFTTSQGTITGSPATTNANGEAEVTLTADDEVGLAQVTAQSQNYGSQKIEVVIFNDKVYVDDARLVKPEWQYEEGAIKFYPGDKVNLKFHLRTISSSSLVDLGVFRKADLEYETLDNQNNPVTGLSGSINNISVGVGTTTEKSLTIPESVTDGIYTLNVLVTDKESLKTDNLSVKFRIGQGENKILFISPSDLSLDPYYFDLKNYGSMSIKPYLAAFEDLGEDYDIWSYGIPSLDMLKKYPVVIFNTSYQETAYYSMSDVLNSIVEYLKLGGNAFVTGNSDIVDVLIYGVDARASLDDDDFYFSGVGFVNSPEKVEGLSGSLFNGKSFDIDAYNLSGDGLKDQLVADEIKVKAGAQEILKFPSGINNPAVAGLAIDTGVYKLVYLGFGFEGINNNTGSNTREEFLETVFDYFKPDSISINSVSPSTVIRGKNTQVTIKGDGFVAVGTTTVTVKGTELTDVQVLDRNTIQATLPSSFTTVGLHDLKVKNPFNQEATLNNALRVIYPAPKILSVSPKSGSNEKTQTITINGRYFRPGATIKLNGKTLTSKVLSSNKIIATVPKGLPVGFYSLKVTNNDGQSHTLSKVYKIIYPAFTLITGAGLGGGPQLRSFDQNGDPTSLSFFAFSKDFKGGVNVATGDTNGDGQDEIIVGAGSGGGPQVRIFDSQGKLLNQFFAYASDFKGGVNVACGDINGDGKDEIITGAGPGGSSHVRVFSHKGKLLLQFFAFHPNFRGGVNVAAGDVNGDGKDEIIAGAGLGGGPHVRVFDQKGRWTGWDMFPFHPNFRGGVNVAAGDVDRDGKDEIGVCQASNGEAWCKVYKYNKAHTILGEWRAYPRGVECGASIAMFDIDRDGKAEVLTGAGIGGGPQVRAFRASGENLKLNFFAYDENFKGGITVAGGRF